MDVAAWLRGLGLERYEQAFRDNEIDWEVLPNLSSDDLGDIGVAAVGHRRKLLDAIAALGAAVLAATVPAASGDAPAPADAERRQLTVMFCDLVGSTALSARLDPEDLRAVIGAYHRCVAKVIGRGGGFVAKYMGDGVLAYFGYPRADEHDAERAVRAALKLVEKVAGLDTVAAAPLQVRVGIATGLVVVGDLIGQGASQEQAVVGETPNLAARLQALAEPGAVVIAPSTRRLTGGLFEYVDLGAIELRGLGAPVMASRVVRGSAAESRFEALHGRELTPLVGRDEELALLQRRWQQAKTGEGRVVVLIGEPGIGKSRLAQAMLQQPAGEPHTRLRYFCSPHHQASALHPFITQIEHAAGFSREDTAEARLAKLEALLARSDAGAEEIAFIAERMSIPTGDKYPLPDLTPQRRKEKTLEALLAQMARLAARQPVLMLFEDAHWIDPTSLELLTLTVARASTLPLLLLVTARPEFTPPWPAEAHVTTLPLARLGRREGMTLVARSAGGKALPAEILEQILARTDGVPLFLEELTKTIIESGLLREEDGHYALDGALPPLAIPTTLHDSLMARLDRLAPVREVAQIGAAIGREFSYPLLSAVANQPGDRLTEALDRLVRAELVFGRGEVPEAVYTFKHALVQEAAYASLLRERRRTLHARIAQALEGAFAEVAETQPELVAHHYAAAGLPAPAIDYYRRAAERAMAASANADAIAHLTKGLELIASLPASSERILREIDFRLALGTPLIAIQGWASVEAEAAYTRAKELCAGAGETPELFRSLVGLWVYHLNHPDLDTASELSRQLFNLAAKLRNDELRLLAEYVACITCCWSGRYTSVPSHAARVRVLYDPERHRGPKIFMADPAVLALTIESLALWCLGYPDRASERGLAALSTAQTVAHPFSLGWALFCEAWLRILRREPELMAARTKAYLAVAREQGFAFDCAAGSMLEIWHDAWVTGQCADDRIEAFKSALAWSRRIGSRLGLGLWHALFAQCLEKQGNTDEALTALEAALVHFERTGDATWEPEVHRLMGDLLLRQNPSAPDRAEVSYWRAIERARSQEAKSWELRAATSLARLWRDQGKPAEARELLAPVYGWFTEGFDTLDLKEAKALLEELGDIAVRSTIGSPNEAATAAATDRPEARAMEISAWLRSLGLEQYGPTFRENDIDADVLPELTEAHLERMGLSLGQRLKLLRAIAALHKGAVPPAAEPNQTSPAPQAESPRAERRQLTVMFCDLVGSTALSARLDPEDLRAVIGAYHGCCANVISRGGGFVAKYMGDGVLVYFGYPRADEHDAERAVRSGLALVEAVAGLDTAAETPLEVRVGIATGLVVVGDLIGQGAAQEQAVVGETPNLAARLQALAEPGTVVIAPSTRRLTGGLFEYMDLGAVELRGLGAPVMAARVLRGSAAESRFEALHGRELTPLVGRDEELALLRRRWQQAKAGEGRVALISGEPGIGKSRLTAALAESIAGEPHTRLLYFSSPHHQDSALYPLIIQLERAAGFARDDTPEEKLGKLRALITGGAADSDEITLIADLLSLPNAAAELDMSPQRKREKLLIGLLHQLEALARSHPVLMVFEDAHWIDPTSRDLIDLTVDRIRRLPVLLLITFRPEFQPPWTDQSHVATLALNRLGERHGSALVEQLAGNAGVSSELVAEIVERSDGVPLFIEELTKAVVEAGADRGELTVSGVPASSLAVPATLHASLLGRLDRLGPAAKLVAQAGAAIGRDFSYDLVAAAAELAEPGLQDALRRLVGSGLVFQRGMPPAPEYLFKHALVQDTAYRTLLRGPRQALHRRIATALEAQFPSVLEVRPELAAHHYGEAAMAEKAVPYWLLAGKLSVAKSAVEEAIAQLRRGLGLLGSLPETPERSRLELDLHIPLTAALTGARGYAHAEVSAALDRSRQLIAATTATGTPLHFSVLYGVLAADNVRGNVKAALEQAQQFLSLAERQPASAPRLTGHRILGYGLLLAGDFRQARPHFELAASLYRPEEHRELAFRYGQDIGASALCQLSLALWHDGYPDQAARTADRALLHARGFGHAYTLAYTLLFAAIHAVLSRDVQRVERLANESATISKEHGFRLWLANSDVQVGWAAAHQGQAVDGIDRMRRGIAAATATGARLWEPFHLGLVAEALALDGKVDQGLAELDQAIARSTESGERWADAELHRLHGDFVCRLSRRDPDGAESSFRAALSIAREQGTKGFELRAATNLARLWRDQGKPAEARDLLAPVYGWFTEGFDTPDLKDAKALLDQLA